MRYKKRRKDEREKDNEKYARLKTKFDKFKVKGVLKVI